MTPTYQRRDLKKERAGCEVKSSICARTDMGQVAILGGIFAPVHWRHLLIAETALSQVRLEWVYVGSHRQPHHKHVCGYEHRLLMVESAESAESAIKDNPAFMLSPRDD